MLPLIVDETFEPHWNAQLSNSDYHADKTAVSSTAIKKMLKSPMTYLSYIKGESPFKQTKEMRLGTSVHLALLEPEAFKKLHVVMPKFSGIGMKAKKEEWLASLPVDAEVVTEDELAAIEGVVESVMKHKDAKNMLRHGKAEISGYFRDPGTGIKCKIRPDFFLERHMAVMDLKTTENCEKDAFSRSIWSWRYDIQMGMYCAGIEHITGKKVEYAMYLAVEKVPPYECAVYRCDEGLVTRGKLEYEACLDRLKTCIETNQWDFYQKKMDMISLPHWASFEKEGT